VDWTRAAAQVAAQIRGLSPYPGAWCDSPGGRLKLLNARPVAGAGAPGEVLPGLPTDGLRIACGTGAVVITKAQRAGGRVLPADEFLRGTPLPAGTVLS